MITGLVSHDGKILVLSNGVYGERIQKIAECYGIDNEVLSIEWGREFDYGFTHQATVSTLVQLNLKDALIAD